MPRYIDHLGNEYASLTKMAEAYGIERCVLKARLERGWKTEEALTTPVHDRRSGECTDHLGNRYADLKSMAEAYGVDYAVLRARLKRGWTLEWALMASPGVFVKTACRDHLGKEYANFSALARAYGLHEATLHNRLRNGMPLEQALTVRAKKRRKTFTDHLGNEYPTLKAMLEKYGVSSSAYCKRRRKGWTEKECLLGRKKKKSRPSKLQIMESKKRLKTTENKTHHHLELTEDPNTRQ
jgi:lambda repressor-like predicted transcriptional regulator